MPSLCDQMINHETGEIDHEMIAAAAQERATRTGDSLPECARWCTERSAAMRRAWQRQKGLPVDGESPEELVLMSCPDWGASGDSFARRR